MSLPRSRSPRMRTSVRLPEKGFSPGSRQSMGLTPIQPCRMA